jgi:hypothetical protein
MIVSKKRAKLKAFLYLGFFELWQDFFWGKPAQMIKNLP